MKWKFFKMDDKFLTDEEKDFILKIMNISAGKYEITIQKVDEF